MARKKAEAQKTNTSTSASTSEGTSANTEAAAEATAVETATEATNTETDAELAANAANAANLDEETGADTEEEEAEEPELTGVAEVDEVAEEPLPGTGVLPVSAILLEVDPDNITIDPDLKALREWSGSSRQETRLIELARTIYEEGQREYAKAFKVDDEIVLYDGHRRREAVQIIRDEWDATWMLKIVVDENLTRDRAIRAAMLCDSQHEQFTPRERARNIAFLRKYYKWTGAEGTAKIAEFLGVSPATVTQDERLAKAPKEVQDKVEDGRLTVTNALELIASTGNVAKEEQPAAQKKIVERAAAIATEEARRDPPPAKREPTAAMRRSAAEMQRELKEKRDLRQRATGDDLPNVAENDPARGKQETVAPEDAPIRREHVKQAAQEVLGDQAKVKAWKAADTVEFFEPLCGPAYPKPMMRFAEAFIQRVKGETSDKELLAAWDNIADALSGPPVTIAMFPPTGTVAETKPVKKAAAKPASKPPAKPVAKKPVASIVKKKPAASASSAKSAKSVKKKSAAK